MTDNGVGRQGKGIHHGDHLCMVYEDRAEQMAAAVPFIKDGLAAGECCAYVADDQTVEEVTAALAAAGVDVAGGQRRGALRLLTKQDAYLRSGSFDPEAMIDFLRATVEQALADGFTGFRLAAEMTWALGSEAGCDRLVEYEALLNRFFPGSKALALCQYNRRRFSPAVIHETLRTHPLAILGGQVCESLYYEPPELIPEGDHEAERVEWMIGQLKRREQERSDRRKTDEELSQRNERIRLLWEAAAVLLTTEEPDAMMRGLFARIAPHFGLDAYFNFVVDEAGEALRMESCVGIPEETARSISRLEFGQAICGTVALQRHPVVATFIQQSDDPKAQLVKSFGLRAYACSPLLAGGRLVGTLSFASRSRDEFDAGELEFLATVCRYVAAAYERLRLLRQLRETDRKKDEFLATLAHELRNPLAPIRNAAQYLRLRGSTGPDLQNAREIIDRQVQHLSRLVDDLLDVSRITRGKITLQKERVSLGVIVANAVESCRPLVESAGHELTVSLPPEPMYLDGDLTRLSQVFANLLTNAAKYTDRGGRIWLTTRREGSDVVVSVRDSGIGIEAEQLPRLFTIFSQVDSALDRTQGGLGIGLSLVKGLVQLHGGGVEARSDGLGKGSEFIVRLPLMIEAPVRREVEVAGVEPVGNHHRRCRILVADDNVDAAQSLAMLLSVMGHEVRTVHDGLAAVEGAEAFRPELILLDIGMPKLNGYEAARRIRGQPWSEGMLLVALTGWGQEEDRRQAEQAGFDRHFMKPADLTALEQLLASLRPTAGASDI